MRESLNKKRKRSKRNIKEKKKEWVKIIKEHKLKKVGNKRKTIREREKDKKRKRKWVGNKEW